MPLSTRSLIASFLGNVVGALMVGLPATYYYLRDHHVGGLHEAENGGVLHNHSFGSKDRISEEIETKQRR
jgi:hypothetical protein